MTDNSVTAQLARTPLFQPLPFNSTPYDALEQSYQRARAIGRAFAMTGEDVVYCSEKFWAIHRDCFSSMDFAAYTLMTIQYNLMAGTLAPYAFHRPELQPLLKSVMNFDVSAQYLLTEVLHGLDSPNLETTATLLHNGEFDLHTPHPGAAKVMPPTLPKKGFRRVAVVMARLIVDEEDRGIRPFVVTLNDGNEMCKGISGRPLPSRGGSRHLDHAITYFNHVRLPAEAILGDLEKPKDMRLNFMKVIWRVSVGSLALTTWTASALQLCAYIVGKYSLRRMVKGPDGSQIPIMSFRTQQRPILHALAAGYVLDAYGRWAAQKFVELGKTDKRVQSGIAAAEKAVMGHHSQYRFVQLGARCGWQGLYNYNQISEIEINQRGCFIAEGDSLVLCIRLASELLIGRYALPSSQDPNSLLAKYEIGLFEECKAMLKSIGGNHRSEAYNRLILPLSEPLIKAIGHRMAYDAAVAAKVDLDLIKLFEVGAVQDNLSWFVENGVLSREEVHRMEDELITRLVPQVDELLDATGVAPYVTSPIVADQSRAEFFLKLPLREGNAKVNLVTPKENSNGLVEKADQI